ncbi:translation initiation factor IF-3 [Desulfobotulus sp. H1]|uniref:Translation initiation factor IF-3 n=1 Tax=Desulfobotulus pelophilus TaxID=2823377 RepID=A0ABT3NCG4_9BACT|nr:translation initiation factor IF-3 [Desulfobotulus pelophilus]MCW7755172.1 translation initiation factor IF-3 [Desulfobotulus pelophilus]
MQQSRTRINRNIRAKEVRVIDPDGEQLGIMPVPKALDIAAGLALDLVEVSPQAKPPVCKIMDYGRFKYELTKKQQEARKKQTVVQLKEVKVRPKTGDHDLETKLKNIRKFIEKRNKVKVTVMFRGREITMSDRGRSVLESIIAEVEDVAVVESTPKFEGRTMMMILVPKT